MMYNKKRSVLVIIVFLVLLLIPNLLMLTSLEKKSQYANLTSFPDLKNETKKTALVKLKKYYMEHFGLKSTLVNYYIKFKVDLLNEDPLPNRVLKGSDDWYFLGDFHNNVISNTFGMNTISDIDLHNMKRNLSVINKYFSDRGIKFYFIVPPSKSTIYTEHLPFNIKQKPTPFSQFLATIKPSDSINYIDLRNTLIMKKEGNQLFQKTDTHWNSQGAYFAYEHIMGSIVQDFKKQTVVPQSFFELKNDSIQGDITRMINNYEKEIIKDYNSPQNSNVETIVNTYKYHLFKNKNRNLKLLMYRDSFGYELFPFLNESFNEVVYIKYDKDISKTKIEEEEPDIVILEVSERNFDVLLKKIRLTK